MEYSRQRKWHLKGSERAAHTRTSEKFWMILNRSEPDEDRGYGWRANKSSPKGLTSRHCFPICISSFNPHNGPKREELLITLTFWVRRLRSRDSRYLV